MRILGQKTGADFDLIRLGSLQLNRIHTEERNELKHKYVLVNPFYPTPLETTVLDHILGRHPIQFMLFGRKVHRVELASFHMQALGLTHRFDQRVNQLGSQERMLTRVVKALMRNPELVMIDAIGFKLCDETWIRLLDHLSNLVRNEGRSVLVNRMDEMTYPYLQRILAFDQGRLVIDNGSEKVDWQRLHPINAQRSMNTMNIMKPVVTFDESVGGWTQVKSMHRF